MAWFDSHLLTILVFLPLVWGTLGLFLFSRNSNKIRNWALAGSFITFILSVFIYFLFDGANADFQLGELLAWVPSLGISYNVGIDGIALWLILLTTFLTPLVILSSFTSIKERQSEYYFLLLALETGMLGAFVALDVFLFYIFWEAMLIPMYFLIGVWGGKERIYAAMKFFLYTVVGSLLMLIAIFYISYQHKVQFGVFSTSILDLYRVQFGWGGFFSPQSLLFLAFAFAFAIKVPLFPLHTWLPDAHVQAPTAGSVILAGVLLKMGGYGFIRFAFPLFPDAVRYYQIPFMVLGSVAIVYGACVAMVQPDLKKLVAYSSVSHMGYVILGLFSLNLIATTGSVYQMLNHGVSTGALFLLVGMIYERRHTREIAAFGGIAKVMPLYAIIFMIITLSSVALPGTNGFIGEFMILIGTWKTNWALTAVAGLGVILGAVYMLWMYQRIMFGPVVHKENKSLKDLTTLELSILLPLVIAVFVMGIFPQFVFTKLQPSVEKSFARCISPQRTTASESKEI